MFEVIMTLLILVVAATIFPMCYAAWLGICKVADCLRWNPEITMPTYVTWCEGPDGDDVYQTELKPLRFGFIWETTTVYPRGWGYAETSIEDYEF